MATLKLLGMTPPQKESLVKLAEADNRNYAMIGSDGQIKAIDFSVEKIHEVARALSSTPCQRKPSWQWLDLSTDLIEFDYTINCHGDLVTIKLHVQMEDCVLMLGQKVIKNDDLRKAIWLSTDWDESDWTVDDYIAANETDVLYILAATVILSDGGFFEDEEPAHAAAFGKNRPVSNAVAVAAM